MINLLDGINMLIRNKTKAQSSRKWFNQLPSLDTPPHSPQPHSLINLVFHYNKTQISLDRGFCEKSKNKKQRHENAQMEDNFINLFNLLIISLYTA